MASDTSMADALKRLQRVEDVLTGDWTTAGHAVGKAAKREATAVAAAVTGGSGRLTHMGRGTRLSSRYNLSNKGQTIEISLVPPGPWVIMERGAGPHLIGQGRRRRAARYVKAPSYAHPVKGPVRHPGMRQRRKAITRTFERINEIASPLYHEAMVRKIDEIYG